MQTKVSNNSKRYIYRKNALGRDKSVMGQMTGAVKNYIKQKNEQRRLTAKEYRKTVRPIATKPVVQSMKKFNHHSQTSCFKHSVHVSYMNYIVCKKLGLTCEQLINIGENALQRLRTKIGKVISFYTFNPLDEMARKPLFNKIINETLEDIRK